MRETDWKRGALQFRYAMSRLSIGRMDTPVSVFFTRHPRRRRVRVCIRVHVRMRTRIRRRASPYVSRVPGARVHGREVCHALRSYGSHFEVQAAVIAVRVRVVVAAAAATTTTTTTAAALLPVTEHARPQ